MRRGSYAVIDVETTTGDPERGRVMEVAVVLMDDGEVTAEWQSLVRPRVAIQPFIKRLTGLHNGMLERAPLFNTVAGALLALTRDRIVVAHNARFDMTALRHEFARTGLPFERPVLCTEQLARQVVPRLTHHNLGSLCRHFNILHHAAHRALPDAHATVALFQHLLAFGGEERALGLVRTVTLSQAA